MRVTILILILFIFLTVTSTAQEYNFLDITVRDGLPQSQINTLVQDHKGYLWIGSESGGLSKYDGLNFETITTREGLPSNSINTLHISKNNHLWIGTNSGFAKMVNNKITETYYSELSIQSIAMKSDTTLWIGCQDGLYVFHKEEQNLAKLKLHPILDGSYIYKILIFENDIWVASNKGLFKIKTDRVIRYESVDGLLSNDIRDIYIDKQNRLWAIQYNEGISAFSQEKFQILYQYTDPSLRKANKISFVNTNELWISTENAGVQQYNLESNSWNSLDRSNGLSTNQTNTVFQDSWKNIWIATNNIGLSKYLGAAFKNIRPSSIQGESSITAISTNSKNEIWYAYANTKIGSLDKDGNNQKTILEIESSVTNLRYGIHDRLWVSTSDNGLLVIDSTSKKTYDTSNGMPSKSNSCTIRDNYNNVLIGTKDKGLWMVDSLTENKIYSKRIASNKSSHNSDISKLTKDHNGQIWCTINTGQVGRIINDSLHIYGRRNGIPNIKITDIAFDQRNQIWISTAGNGLYFAPNNSEASIFSQPIAKDGFINKNAKSLVFDSNFNLWIGSGNSVQKVIFNSSGAIEKIQQFGVNEGFQGLETNEGQAIQDLTGRIWIGTINGLVMYTPKNYTPLETTPITSINNILINNIPEDNVRSKESDNKTSRLTLDHTQNDISFTFNSVDLSHARGIRHSWVLEGKDTEWGDWTQSQNINYSNLSPGYYTFKVKAQNRRLKESKEESFEFYIQAAVWQLWWFQLLCLSLLILSMILFYNWRLNKIRKSEAQKRASLELKSELLTLEQKALQLQMNPHFIFNALNSIQSLIIKEKNSEARKQLLNFSDLMRSILNNSRKDRISLNQEIELLRLYLNIEKECNNGQFTFEISDHTSMDPEEIDIPSMLVQPFVENAVLHGLTRKAEGGNLVISFSLKGRLLHIEVIDNGIGREAASTMKNRNGHHTSSAIDITQKRLTALKNKANYNPLSITDLYDNGGQSSGTKVEIMIPYQTNF